ncbi:MAG TPA: LysE family transporter [Thermoanaerobaculia bacterium]
MSYLPLLLSLFAVDLLAAMSPGPNFLLVTQTAIQRGTRHAAAVVLGFVTTNLMWSLAVLFGLGALFEISPRLYMVMKVAGGAFLIYLGIRLWRGAGDRAIVPQTHGFFLRGLLTNLSNPKSVVYFGSVFTLFLKPGTPVWVNAAAIAIVVTNTILWYGTLAVLFSRARAQCLYATAERPINRVAGTAMIGFGTAILVRE